MIKRLLLNISFWSLLVMTAIIFIGSIQPVYAQPDPCPNPPCDGDVPISGIEILIAIGGLFGASRFFGKRKPNEN